MRVPRAGIALLLAVVLISGPTAFAALGELDPRFAGDGRAKAGFKLPSVALAVAAQPDGRVVAGGAFLGLSERSLIARFLTNGELDRSFSGNGRLSLDLAGRERVVDLALQADGRIVVLACAPCNPRRPNFTFLRLLPDGSFDRSFAGDGVRRLAVVGHGVEPAGMAIQGDGRIVAVGTAISSFAQADGFVTVRLDVDGSLDRSFAGDGRRFVGKGSDLRAGGIAVTPAARIVVAGVLIQDSSLVARLLPDGRLDHSFATDGIYTNHYPETAALSVALDGGRIVLAGYCGDPASSPPILCLSRLTRSGESDASFAGGQPVYAFASRSAANAVTVRADSRVLAVGIAQGTGAAAQFTADGSLDPSFSDDGRLLHVFKEGTLAPLAAAHDVTLLGNGKALLAGEHRDRFAIARLLAA